MEIELKHLACTAANPDRIAPVAAQYSKHWFLKTFTLPLMTEEQLLS